MTRFVRRPRRGLALALLVLASACGTDRSQTAWRPAPSGPGARTVEQLLDVVAAAPKLEFQYLVDTRIHVETGPELATTLRSNYVKAGSPDLTPAEFIERFATHSDGEGATYYVRLPGGGRQTLAQWLSARVAR